MFLSCMKVPHLSGIEHKTNHILSHLVKIEKDLENIQKQISIPCVSPL